jgi:phospholipid/cholesterol/gamma-HCH transport system substrate-binding protein
LMTDSRRTLADISRAVNNLDRNPTRLLFGAGNSSNSQAAEPPPRPGPTPAAAAGERKRP